MPVYEEATPDKQEYLTNPRGETHEHRHFDSSNEFAAWFTTALAERQESSTLRPHTFHGSDATQRMLLGVQYLRDGDATDASEADALLTQFVQEIAVAQYVWDDDVAGSMPDVPLALAGVPEHMLTLEILPNDHSPLRVWVGLSSSAGVTEAQLRKRGIVLAAFAMAMQEIRPVWITPYVNMGWTDRNGYGSSYGIHTSIVSWDIQTSPLVISELLGCTSKPEVTRYIGICANNLLNPYTNSACSPTLTTNAAYMRTLLGASEDDLVLPAIHLYDPMLTDPVAWVNSMVAKYTNPTPSDDTEDAYNDPNR